MKNIIFAGRAHITEIMPLAHFNDKCFENICFITCFFVFFVNKLVFLLKN